TIPAATTGAGPFIDPPCALMPLTVGKSWLVSNVQSSEPSAAANARTAPSLLGENTAPSMTVTAENSAPLQARLGFPHAGGAGAENQARLPVARSTACRPPGSGA